MARLKLGVLISGRGSNLQALIDAAADPAFPAEITVVISNIAGVQGLQRAADAGIETCVIDHKAHDGRAAFESALTEALEAHQVRLVCLAGFMRLLTKGFVDHWRDRIINIHPSLLPAFKGLNTHERVLDYGVKFTGCTVHFVRAEMDEGPIIVQGVVPVISSDTPDRLAARVLQVEHRIYPLAVRLVAEGRARVVGDAVNIDVKDQEAEGVILVNPQA
ncbi:MULTISPECIES: phosphoribosylglycinamide formyltransferase [unclassified Minwuia]|uniref:phosphoribosylglycinamide formyltransferase n=1 Tax=unclassified Minwuia TaxID=2618799 RepID=UPI00247956E5|nr:MULTISPECIES: phosphoribosylglycinamide formyltransferase [unclassified Minwuia]